MFPGLVLLLPTLVPAACDVDELCARFTAFDANADGVLEIVSLAPLASSGEAGARVLLLVEGRDEPRGFAEALAEGQTFGAAWRRYFELESAAESWGRVGGDIGRKRAYFWSILGDWTLRLNMAAPDE